MFDDKNTESIKSVILERLRADGRLSTMAGSFADAMAGPFAEVVSECYQSLPGVVSMLFVDEGSGPYIDAVGQQYFNFNRRSGTRASGAMTLRGDSGTVIPANTVFLSADGLEFRLTGAVAIGASGSASGAVEAMEVGRAYNLPAAALCRMYVNPIGLTSYESGETLGGTDGESDTALLSRIDARRKKPPTSGNGYHYQEWALEIPGVGLAKVVSLAGGPGTVGVSILDTNLAPASEAILEAVRANIEAKRPVGATVTVKSGEALHISVTATVVLTLGTTAAVVQEAFRVKLQSYCNELISQKYGLVYAGPADDKAYDLLYNRVASLLMGIDGVRNFNLLTLNGGAADISIPANSIPSLGSVVVSV